MFSMIFEVQLRAGQRDSYLSIAKVLCRDLNKAPGFVDNIRYKSLTRDGWILSLSNWRDEKSVARWRTDAHHLDAQEKGRAEILSDYHLRVGQLTYDTRHPDGCEVLEQSLDETEVGEAVAITLIDAKQIPDWVSAHNPQEIATRLGFDHNSYGDCISWDVLDDIATPGDILLFILWKDHASATEFAQSTIVPDDARVRVVQVIRDYFLSDRREAPQFYADAAGRGTSRG